MFHARRRDRTTILLVRGALGRAQLVAIAAVAQKARREGRSVLVELRDGAAGRGDGPPSSGRCPACGPRGRAATSATPPAPPPRDRRGAP